MTNGSVLIINGTVALVSVFFSALLASDFTKNNEIETRAYENKKETLSDILQNTVKYSDYNHFSDSVKKDAPNVIIGKHLCDYDSFLQSVAEKNGNNVPCVFYDQLQRAKYNFHELTIKARIMESDKVLNQLNDIESNFDQVFVKYVNTQNYNFLEPDIYNEIMKPSFDRLEILLRNELNRK